MARSGLRIAGPGAYPSLWTRNTIGGGISRPQVDDLIASLGAIASLIASGDGAALLVDALATGGRPFTWRDPSSGTLIQSDGFGSELPPLWVPPSRLATALPEGDRANPLAVSSEESGPLELKQDAELIGRYASSQGGATLNRAERDVSFAVMFTQAMHLSQSIPLRAVTEYDFRIFLYDLFPRVVSATLGDMRDLRSSLRRFLAYLATEEGISYSWASPLLRDRAAFEFRWDTSPHGSLDHGALLEWMAEFM